MCFVLSSRNPKADLSAEIRKIEPQAAIRTIK
jgi:hypothetical protein